jgi:hypothetical protein
MKLDGLKIIKYLLKNAIYSYLSEVVRVFVKYNFLYCKNVKRLKTIL